MSFHPHTPQSPSQASPATHLDSVMATAHLPIAIGPVTLPTPAHSVSGSIYHSDMAMVDDSPNKRKRPLDDIGDREQKKVQYDPMLGIEDLHLDVGKKYLFCQKLHNQSFPRISEDLYEMFNLTGLAAEVAREKPNGEKNALRKTYKGHIKRLGVSGHFDAHKKKEDAPSDFLAMVHAPELEWNVHQVKGKELSAGLPEAVTAALSRALTMSKGTIARSVWDSSVLGELAPNNGETSKKNAHNRGTGPNTPAATTPAATEQSKKTSIPHGSDPMRSRRNIKKRTYGDSSYEGYGEGFPDDEGGADTGYSTGEGEGGQKRRKKNSAAPSPYSAVRQHSYGPGMVGA